MLGFKPHTITRYAPGSDDPETGDYGPGEESTLPVSGSLQPLGWREIKFLPDGERGRARWTFFTTTKLQMTDPESYVQSDELHHGSKRLVVVGVEDWSGIDSPLAHYEYLLAEKEHGG